MFTKNRERLLAVDIAAKFLVALLSQSRVVIPISSILTLTSNAQPVPLGTMRPDVFIRPRIWLLSWVEMPSSWLRAPA